MSQAPFEPRPWMEPEPLEDHGPLVLLDCPRCGRVIPEEGCVACDESVLTNPHVAR